MSYINGLNMLNDSITNLYSLEKLDRALLVVLMGAFKRSFVIDNIQSLKDYKAQTMKQIIVELWCEQYPKKPEEDFEVSPETWFEYDYLLNEKFLEAVQDFGWKFK